jgi:salicylate biosynthesis isochorismate synthase
MACWAVQKEAHKEAVVWATKIDIESLENPLVPATFGTTQPVDLLDRLRDQDFVFWRRPHAEQILGLGRRTSTESLENARGRHATRFVYSMYAPTTRGLWKHFSSTESVAPKVWLKECAEGLTTTWIERDPRLADLISESHQRDATLSSSRPLPQWTVDWAERDFRPRLEQAIGWVHRGDVEKLVVSREVTATANAAVSLTEIVKGLCRRYPSCYVFAVNLPVSQGPPCTFFGASPEILAQASGGKYTTCAMAGTVARGRNKNEDAQIAAGLRSEKEQNEHRIVVSSITEELSGVVATCRIGETSVRRLPNVQHLVTPIHGRLKPGCTVLDMRKALHPTPAVSGYPREKADKILRSLEPHRGLYSGVVGTVDGAGDGVLCVAIRSALLQGRTCRLYAGAGIVDGSTVEAESVETRAKIAAVLDVLRGVR